MLLNYLSSFFYSQKEDIDEEDICEEDIDEDIHSDIDICEDIHSDTDIDEDIHSDTDIDEDIHSDTDIDEEDICEEDIDEEDIEDTDIEGEDICEDICEDIDEEDIDEEDICEEDICEEDICEEDICEEDICEEVYLEEVYLEEGEVYGFGNESPISKENTKLLEMIGISITEIKEENNQRNVYKEYQAYNSKRLLESTKPLLNNFKFSFKRMMIFHGLKNKVETDTAKEWMAAYKIQQYWKNRNKNKNKKKFEKLLQMTTPFVYFPF
jgi:hypothetical protein